jgi:asparagine synthase (glutamine-hydrolysing)
MCGIAGYLAFSDRASPDRCTLDRMVRQLSHRGPDAAGTYIRDNLALGFRRLSIIDPELSNQPMFNEDGSIVLACNGEIFNYRDLRKELAAEGHIFRTQGDTEPLLHLYETCREKLLDRVNGQFAFALYDFAARRLLLARDHFGICPMFYFQSKDVLVFGSEIKAILEHPLVNRELDPAGLDQLLTMPAMTSPTTMFRNIRSIRHGSYLCVNGTTVSQSEYWDLDYPPEGDVAFDGDPDSYAEELVTLLRRSVKLRMQADVDVGVYLSGGLDSSLIAALMREIAPETKRHSFSISVPGNKTFCESRYQNIASRHSKTIHHEIPIDAPGIAARLRATVRHSESPLRETYNAASHALSECARQCGVPVVLCGEGADELFAGYDGYITDYFRHRNPKLTRMQGAIDDNALQWFPDGVLYHDCAGAQATRSGLYSPGLSNAVQTTAPRSAPIDLARLKGRHRIHQRSYLDFVIRLSGHLLADHGDRMAMANSVEARYPFLDIDLVSFVTQIPPEMKFDGVTGKAILRRSAKGLIANEILQRHKFPFSTPGSPELLRHKVAWIDELLCPERIRKEGYFRPEAIRSLRDRYLSPEFELNVSSEEDWLLLVITFGLWLEEFRMPDLN